MKKPLAPKFTSTSILEIMTAVAEFETCMVTIAGFIGESLDDGIWRDLLNDTCGIAPGTA